MKAKLINCKLTDLIGKNVKGIVAQVTNPIYICEEIKESYRKLIQLKHFKREGKWWVELYYEKEPGDSCGYTGCTVESNSCTIQITPEELKKMNKQSKQVLS